MPDKRLVAVVTALMMSALAPGADAEATLEQLETIDRLLSANDTRALWAYMQQYPELLSGEDELSLELRKFCNDVTLGRLSCHYVPGSSPAEAAGADAAAAQAGGVAASRAADVAGAVPY
ncbi:hypothetical protein [Tropicimonas isoalkanivorans]|uniref:Uncharacterized protein n=1 Tax=Tropicimonas isoalkanivorans TaxID=441112 RepID=A0A1I1HIL4_9RHOB|nr:hypothetical protein [Tropicimonas isoalkanivorans]SFC23691.1 hypothetical protein SAMN04488094_103170 [Tropicimonas isoalkanivorans]